VAARSFNILNHGHHVSFGLTALLAGFNYSPRLSLLISFLKMQIGIADNQAIEIDIINNAIGIDTNKAAQLAERLINYQSNFPSSIRYQRFAQDPTKAVRLHSR
jgi:hypothetical protein